MVIFREEIDSVVALRVRDLFHRVMVLGFVLVTILVSFSVLVRLTQCPSSIVVVISGSMEPGYRRGDVLLLHRRFEEYPVRTGDIVVYSSPKRFIPIVHRVVRLHRRERDNKTLLLTKGDNNNFDDRFLYDPSTGWVEEDQIIGKSYAYIPRLGYVTIALAEYLWLRILSFLILLFFLISSDEL